MDDENCDRTCFLYFSFETLIIAIFKMSVITKPFTVVVITYKFRKELTLQSACEYVIWCELGLMKNCTCGIFSSSHPAIFKLVRSGKRKRNVSNKKGKKWVTREKEVQTTTWIFWIIPFPYISLLSLSFLFLFLFTQWVWVCRFK
jgi:hypothetical protein